MRLIWSFLCDPGLHLLVIALALIALAIGSTGPQEPREVSALVACSKCRSYHSPDWLNSCPSHANLAQARP
jgi:hypothetical protein